MCGLLGSSSTHPINMDKLKLLYMHNIERGKHSCGFSDGNSIIKAVGSAEDFLYNEIEKDDFPKEITSFIGHTRHATKGEKTTTNAHPFKIGDKLIGAHNGTIDNFNELKEIFNVQYAVDSEFIYYLLSKFKLKQVLPLFQGALTLTYHNLHEGCIEIYRYGRPLFFGRDSENKEILWFSSLKDYLTSIDCVDIEEVDTHTHYKVKDGQIIHKEKLHKSLEPDPSIFYSKNIQIPKVRMEDKMHHLKALKDPVVDAWIKKSKENKTLTEKVTKGIPKYASLVIVGTMPYNFWFAKENNSKVYVKIGTQVPFLIDLNDTEDNGKMWVDLPEAVSLAIYYKYLELSENINAEEEINTFVKNVCEC